MPTKGTSVKGIRLPDRVWDAIDAEAEAMSMTRNEFLNRRLCKAFSRVPEVGKSDKIVDIPDIDEEGEEIF